MRLNNEGKDVVPGRRAQNPFVRRSPLATIRVVVILSRPRQYFLSCPSVWKCEAS
jgi:hypothetical protein